MLCIIYLDKGLTLNDDRVAVFRRQRESEILYNVRGSENTDTFERLNTIWSIRIPTYFFKLY
jgi:hypothetical protein